MVKQKDAKFTSSKRHNKSTTVYGKLLSVHSLHISLSSDEKRTAFRRVREAEMRSHHKPTPSSVTHNWEGTQKSRASP